MAAIDHLVVATLDLASGARWLEEKLGAPLAPGGVHAAMGTHNRLLRLGSKLYLELVAIDPAGATPARPRWFGLDEPVLQSRLTARPHLVHWVARSDDLAREATPAHGDILAMQRGHYRWRITVPADGRLPDDGLLPTLIQWDVPTHPAEGLPDSGCTLLKLESFHAVPARLAADLACLDLARELAVFPAEPGEPAQLVAYLKTPSGLVELD